MYLVLQLAPATARTHNDVKNSFTCNVSPICQCKGRFQSGITDHTALNEITG